MEVHDDTIISPPHDDGEYKLKIIDHGHGNHRLSITPTDERDWHNFTITNQHLQECQWRDKENELPTPIHRAVEYYGYHVTDVVRRPKHGLYENVRYLRESVEEIESELHTVNYIGKSAANWATESLESLQKLELLREHLTEAEFEIVLIKAQESSVDTPSGQLSFPTTDGDITTASLKSVVMLMIAYAQDDGYLDIELIDPEIVNQLVRRPDND